jgi:hypothetical protein
VRSPKRILWLLCSLEFIAALLASPGESPAFSFALGYYYSTSDRAIQEYDPSGNQVASLPAGPGGLLRGLAFGPDGLLYVVRDVPQPSSGTETPTVEALNADGSVVRSYTFGGLLSNDLFYGAITFDPSGSSFYVGANQGVYRFDTTGATGSLFLSNQFSGPEAFQMAFLPGGQFLVASFHSVTLYSSTGVMLSTISNLSDPNKLTGDIFPMLNAVTGVAYDPKSDSTFVTMIGDSGLPFALLRLAGTSSTITDAKGYWYGADPFLTPDGKLLVGSGTQAPGVFTTADLTLQTQLGTTPAIFVTEFVPEPSTAVLLAAGLGGMSVWRRQMRSPA